MPFHHGITVTFSEKFTLFRKNQYRLHHVEKSIWQRASKFIEIVVNLLKHVWLGNLQVKLLQHVWFYLHFKTSSG